VAVAACEILLSVLCASFPEVSQSMSQSQLVSICTSLLQIETYGEHIAYLTVRTICHEHADTFFDIVQAYPELLTSLAGVLLDSDASTSTIKFIVTFFQNLLDVSPAMATVLVRQTNVLDAVTSVASMHMRSSISTSGTANVEMRRTATTLLFALSNDVCNRRLLARQPRALPSMIGFVREYPPTAQQATAAMVNNVVRGGNLGSRAALCYREVWKERILQLAAVL
jgi:hypothetical protein